MMRTTFSIRLLSLVCVGVLYGESVAQQCEVSWVPYKDEKCFRIIDQYVSHDEALLICSQLVESSAQIPLLLTIKSAEEQDWLTKFVFEESQVVDNVWLGATRHREGNGSSTTDQFEWADGLPVTYSNWHEGNPSDIDDHDCTIMMPKGVKGQAETDKNVQNRDGAVDGLWADSLCSRRSVVVCQKLQSWSLLQVQKTVLEMRQNPVPIGFVYVQLPSQPNASHVWPTVTWADVTEEYAGYFFRAEGGGSESFGTAQAQNVPRISDLEYTACDIGAAGCGYPAQIKVPSSGWSDWLLAGAFPGDYNYLEALHLHVEDGGGEVRPKNMAVRVWKRVQ